MKIGSLFSGYGGLDMGVQAVLGGDVAWHVEVDNAASRVLDHHWPDVPNLGDITAVDWSQVEPVDVLTGGFPCQDVSHAGKRAGIRPDTRSGLWSHFAYAIDQLRPELVVIENVRGLLSAKAHSDVEPCAWCVGDDTDGALRALGAVLGDLAGLGYDARWAGVRAADAGAPHGRFRIFIVAYPQDVGHEWPWDAWRRWDGPVDSGHAPTDAAGDGRHEGRAEPAGIVGRHDVTERGATPADADSAGPLRVAQLDSEPQPGREGGEHRGHADRLGVEARRMDWGDYAAAIHRWEATLGRVAPPPTEVGAKGQPRLSPRFVEWMMGLPAGHVTGVDISRNDQLKALGNGVVPQQAELALRWLLFGEWATAYDDSALLPTPNTMDSMGPRSADALARARTKGGCANLKDVLLPTPAVNDMGAGKTVEAWDEWTDRMKAEHGNGNGHGKSLAVEAQRLGGDAA